MDSPSLGALIGDDPSAGVVLLDEDAECGVVAGGVIENDTPDAVREQTLVIYLIQKVLESFQVDC
jgi:hypothetical protein